jgi:predicted enzyme related to lactoylglutathione lyase
LKTNVHAFGMFIRFSPKGSTAPEFFRKGLELPVIRVVGDNIADIFWGGECSIFEIVYVKDKSPAPEATVASAASVPIFRVHDLEALRARWTARGAVMTPTQPRGNAREAYVADPDGYWIGFRESAADSKEPHDVEARRRRRRGETFNPGCKSMPEGVQEIGWLVRRVADVAAMTKFYRDALGLKQLADDAGHARFDLGDNVILELAPGGAARPAPTDRYLGTSAILMRVTDVAAFRAAVLKGGGKIVNERVPLHWAELTYGTDPEGAVLGAEQGYHPGAYAPEKFVLPENLEAERRWREYCAAE